MTVQLPTSATPTFEFVGVTDPDKLREHLLTTDPCFGKLFRADAPECRGCDAPVIVGGQVVLCAQLCRSMTKNDTIRALPAALVTTWVAQDTSVEDMFLNAYALLGGEPAAVRKQLKRRLRYLDRKKGVIVPEVPPLAELLHVLD